MRILALETSTTTGSVAALEDDRVLGQTVFDPQLRTAQSFAPAMAQQLAAVGWTARDIELIAVTVGPGSFTGLRVGVTAAKTLAYTSRRLGRSQHVECGDSSPLSLSFPALAGKDAVVQPPPAAEDKAVTSHRTPRESPPNRSTPPDSRVETQLIGLNTLAVIAAQAPAELSPIYAVLDAQRQQLFAACFEHDGPRVREILATQIVDNDRWLAALPAGATVTGSGLARLRERLPAGVHVVDEQAWVPQAATVGRLGYLEYRSGKRDDLWQLVPRYYRKSAAEEKLEGGGLFS